MKNITCVQCGHQQNDKLKCENCQINFTHTFSDPSITCHYCGDKIPTNFANDKNDFRDRFYLICNKCAN